MDFFRYEHLVMSLRIYFKDGIHGETVEGIFYMAVNRKQKGELEMYRKKWLLAMGIALAMGLSGCQKNPDSSIVVNKDLDNLIEKAQDGEGSGIKDMKEYDTYQTTLEDASLGVKVTVDAKVDIPETDRMSVIRVKQNAISQELLDKVREELVKGETLYDGSLLETKTRSDIEAEIHSLQEAIEEQKASGHENMESSIEALQSDINLLQEEYENAPAQITWDGNESDGQLHRVSEKYEQDTSDEFYAWEYSLNPNGEVYYGVSDGEDGMFTSLFVQNNENRGNCLRFRRGRHGYVFVATAVVGSSNLNDPYADMIWKAEEEMPSDLMEVMTGGMLETQPIEFEDEKASMTQEEAQEMAEEFLEKTGLSGYQYYEGGLYCEISDIRYGTEIDCEGYSTWYILRYARNIDGAFVTFDATGKHEEGWNGDAYVKKDWPVECIEFRITDDGIVGFDYNAPLEELETVVEDSAMKSFDEVKNTFEKMVLVTNAQEDNQVSIQIDRVVLGYARISEADSYDTGLLVPVWDFQGTTSDQYTYAEKGNGANYGSVLTVNAIDGSIIDRTLGY